MKSTNRDMAHSTFFWGVAKTYRFGAAVMAVSWDDVDARKKRAIEKKLDQIAQKIIKRQNHIQPSLKTKIFFSVMSKIQKSGWNAADANYWKERGWTEKKRPWKA